MPYKTCAADVAASIQGDCQNPIVAGYTGRGVLIPWDINPTLTTEADNPRTITAITLPTGKKAIAINNAFAEPFTGSNTASSADNGRTEYTKTVALRIPLRGSNVSRDIVEPLASSALGFIAVLEKKDRTGDGSFEVIGALQGLRVNADGISREEASNGGDISVTMSCVEPFFECDLFDTNYTESKDAFETLLENTY